MWIIYSIRNTCSLVHVQLHASDGDMSRVSCAIRGGHPLQLFNFLSLSRLFRPLSYHLKYFVTLANASTTTTTGVANGARFRELRSIMMRGFLFLWPRSTASLGSPASFTMCRLNAARHIYIYIHIKIRETMGFVYGFACYILTVSISPLYM